MTDEPTSKALVPAEIVDGDGLDLIAARLVEAAQADGIADRDARSPAKIEHAYA